MVHAEFSLQIFLTLGSEKVEVCKKVFVLKKVLFTSLFEIDFKSIFNCSERGKFVCVCICHSPK